MSNKRVVCTDFFPVREPHPSAICSFVSYNFNRVLREKTETHSCFISNDCRPRGPHVPARYVSGEGTQCSERFISSRVQLIQTEKFKWWRCCRKLQQIVEKKQGAKRSLCSGSWTHSSTTGLAVQLWKCQLWSLFCQENVFLLFKSTHICFVFLSGHNLKQLTR